jgi:hypothetical protein
MPGSEKSVQSGRDEIRFGCHHRSVRYSWPLILVISSKNGLGFESLGRCISLGHLSLAISETRRRLKRRSTLFRKTRIWNLLAGSIGWTCFLQSNLSPNTFVWSLFFTRE